MSTDANQRRAKGEGSIFLRKDGRWVGQLPLPNGKRKYFTGRSSIEVTRKLNAALGPNKPPVERSRLSSLARKEHTAAMLMQTQEQLRDARRTIEQMAGHPTASLVIKQIAQGFRKRHPSSAD